MDPAQTVETITKNGSISAASIYRNQKLVGTFLDCVQYLTRETEKQQALSITTTMARLRWYDFRAQPVVGREEVTRCRQSFLNETGHTESLIKI